MDHDIAATSSDPKVFLSRAELAEVLGTNLSTVNGWAGRSPLVPFPRPVRQRRNELLYDRDHLVEWLGQQSAALSDRGQDWWSNYFHRHYRTLSGRSD